MSSRPQRILLIEDDPAQRDALSLFLREEGFDVDACASAEEGLERVREQTYALLITDLMLPGMNGLELIERALSLADDLAALLVTAFASIDTAIEALRRGASDYLLKPLILEDVLNKIEQILRQRALNRDNQRLQDLVTRLDPPSDFIATSAAMQEVLDLSKRAAQTAATVLITGETGAGKEVVARLVHKLSERRDEPFLAINASALPDDMVSSELFGYERGAFTGADRDRDGILRAAGHGTVFLDEIGELSPSVQAKLLRALEQHEVQPLGSDTTAPFQARILTATHRDLKKRVEEGTFREDLFFRLNVIHIHIPALRERPEDIPDLAEHLLHVIGRRLSVRPPEISASAMQALCCYSWPGNTRELANVLERALILIEPGESLEPDHLPAEIASARLDEGWDLRAAVDRFERAHIARVLRRCDGNRERSAELLGLSIATLYRRLDKLGLKGYEVHRGSESTTA